MAVVTEADMFRRGAEHARSGKQCTPFDCQAVDKELFAASKFQERPAKWYAEMRGAFNDGWQAENFKITSDTQ